MVYLVVIVEVLEDYKTIKRLKNYEIYIGLSIGICLFILESFMIYLISKCTYWFKQIVGIKNKNYKTLI